MCREITAPRGILTRGEGAVNGGMLDLPGEASGGQSDTAAEGFPYNLIDLVGESPRAEW